jgi:hypothetical protein
VGSSARVAGKAPGGFLSRGVGGSLDVPSSRNATWRWGIGAVQVEGDRQVGLVDRLRRRKSKKGGLRLDQEGPDVL